MKKVLLIACLAISLSSYSKSIVNSWICDETEIIMYDDNTCKVGELIYDVKESDGKVYLHLGNKLMLFGNLTQQGSLVM